MAISEDAAIAGREQIYAVLADRARRDFAASGRTTPPAPDTLLGRLVAHADEFGVLNAAPLAAALGTPLPRPASSVTAPEFTLTFESGTFALMTLAGRWRIQFPWYFMLGAANRVEVSGQPPFDVVSLSTLTAANATPAGGASQATILIVSSESVELPQLTAMWLDRLNLTPDDTTAKGSPQAMRAYKGYDTQARMNIEMNAFKIPSGSLLVIYVGLDGTYLTNRQHYLDLMATLRVR